MIPLIAEYALGIIIGVVLLGSILVCVAAGWKPKRVAYGLLYYFFVWPLVCFLVLTTFFPGVLQCADALSR